MLYLKKICHDLIDFQCGHNINYEISLKNNWIISSKQRLEVAFYDEYFNNKSIVIYQDDDKSTSNDKLNAIKLLLTDKQQCLSYIKNGFL